MGVRGDDTPHPTTGDIRDQQTTSKPTDLDLFPILGTGAVRLLAGWELGASSQAGDQSWWAVGPGVEGVGGAGGVGMGGDGIEMIGVHGERRAYAHMQRFTVGGGKS